MLTEEEERKNVEKSKVEKRFTRVQSQYIEKGRSREYVLVAQFYTDWSEIFTNLLLKDVSRVLICLNFQLLLHSYFKRQQKLTFFGIK